MNALTTITTANAELTMSSREIAELTGKEHDNVRRDIQNMAKELSLKIEEKVMPSSGGRPSKVYFLSKDLTITLVSGYNVKMRYAITKRWMELEEQNKKSIPTDYEGALLMALEVERQRKALLLENEAMKPAASLGKAVGKLKSITIPDFAKKLVGVNSQAVQTFLGEQGYLYKDAKGKWVVRAKYRDVYFNMAMSERTQGAYSTIVVTEKGQQLLVKLYEEGRLPMKKGFEVQTKC